MQKLYHSITTNWRTCATQFYLWYRKACTAFSRIGFLSSLSRYYEAFCLAQQPWVIVTSSPCSWNYHISLHRMRTEVFAVLNRETCNFAITKLSLFLLYWYTQYAYNVGLPQCTRLSWDTYFTGGTTAKVLKQFEWILNIASQFQTEFNRHLFHLTFKIIKYLHTPNAYASGLSFIQF